MTDPKIPNPDAIPERMEQLGEQVARLHAQTDHLHMIADKIIEALNSLAPVILLFASALIAVTVCSYAVVKSYCPR